jgi:cytoskeletal protein CcmA (bactofilin family)
MSWLGQKSDPEPVRPNAPAIDANPTVVRQPIFESRGENVEMHNVASIGRSLHVKGELSGNEDLAIEGKVEGKITLNGYSVTIGETGQAAAEIHAKSVVVGGLVKGDINADERVEVLATGTMVGDIRAPRVILVDGCKFKGAIDMDAKMGTGTKAKSNPSTAHEPASAYAGSSKS